MPIYYNEKMANLHLFFYHKHGIITFEVRKTKGANNERKNKAKLGHNYSGHRYFHHKHLYDDIYYQKERMA